MSARRKSRSSGATDTPPGGSSSAAALTPGGRRRSVTPHKALRIEEQFELQGLNSRLEQYGTICSLGAISVKFRSRLLTPRIVQWQ
jgi:hypothetical protein